MIGMSLFLWMVPIWFANLVYLVFYGWFQFVYFYGWFQFGIFGFLWMVPIWFGSNLVCQFGLPIWFRSNLVPSNLVVPIWLYFKKFNLFALDKIKNADGCTKIKPYV